MLSLPETLMLFALHDERGTVFNAAFIGLDETLYSTVLAELMLRGQIRVRTDGALKVEPIRDCDSILLLLAHECLKQHQPRTVGEARAALETGFGKIRSRVIGALAAKGVLRPMRGKRGTAHHMTDGGPEGAMREHLRRGVAAGDAVSRRLGMLIGLVHALDLWSGLVPAEELDAARERGRWVLERDAICRELDTTIRKLEGRWEG